MNRQFLDGTKSTAEDALKLLAKNAKLFYKPVSQSKGKGIKILLNDTEGQQFILNAYATENKKFILEEPIVQHCLMSEINPYSVNTIRVNTVLKKNGDVAIISATLRTASDNSIIDNMSQGGFIFPIDLETGIVIDRGLAYNTNVRPIRHPLTGVVLLGRQIPNWELVLNSCRQSAKQFKKLRWLGWDIAITEDGIEIIEANLSPGPRVAQADGVFKYKIVKQMF